MTDYNKLSIEEIRLKTYIDNELKEPIKLRQEILERVIDYDAKEYQTFEERTQEINVEKSNEPPNL